MTVAAWNELEAAHRTRESTPTERTLMTSLRAKRQELDDLRRSADEAVRTARNETAGFRARVAELEQVLAARDAQLKACRKERELFGFLVDSLRRALTADDALALVEARELFARFDRHRAPSPE